MKTETHPKYMTCAVSCGCGSTFETRATVPTISVEICSACHPFNTGKQKFVDAAGRVEKFMRRYGMKGDSVANQDKGADSGAPATDTPSSSND